MGRCSLSNRISFSPSHPVDFCITWINVVNVLVKLKMWPHKFYSGRDKWSPRNTKQGGTAETVFMAECLNNKSCWLWSTWKNKNSHIKISITKDQPPCMLCFTSLFSWFVLLSVTTGWTLYGIRTNLCPRSSRDLHQHQLAPDLHLEPIRKPDNTLFV